MSINPDIMKRTSYTLLLVFITTLSTFANSSKAFTEKADAFFKKYVKNGSVAYKAINLDKAEITSLYKEIGKMNLSSFSVNEKKAFYINAYNIIVIYWVAEYYPLKSPLDKSGFFDKVKHKVAGEDLSLNALEIKKLLLPYKDGRFHFVLACAAKSCPPLASFAIHPEKLEEQLNERTTMALNNGEWLRVVTADKKVALSKIFDWYKGDFTQKGSAIEWINQYRKMKIPTDYVIEYYEYNWSLNEG
ncbi:DUF547 domain-containing protein [Chryseotalea sanaruensis]|uniref:DUF547 domain-containing protein n=2 Tax=Chryseotalea sanaruensis TaxID=2482724 RepID=A0A401UB83_9BACT|nr:DUF547 domain-containing protein [Chryseotalea sanaruensis]